MGISTRLWESIDVNETMRLRGREYEIVVYVMERPAELRSDSTSVVCEPGDSWVLEKQTRHRSDNHHPSAAVEDAHP
jgi:hypothetical protein